MGPLVLVGGRGFARHGPLRVLGLVVVGENGFDLVLYFYCFLFFVNFISLKKFFTLSTTNLKLPLSLSSPYTRSP